MSRIQYGNINFDISKMQEGSSVDPNNPFLKKFDKDGNSIFSSSELQELQKALEEAAGEDKKLSYEEAIRFISGKMNITLEEAKKLVSGKTDVILNSIQDLANQSEGKNISDSLFKMIDGWNYASIDNPKFKNNFNKITENNILHVLKNYKKASKGESLVSAILKETTSSRGNKIGCVDKLYYLLLNKVNTDKYDLSDVKLSYESWKKDPLSDEGIRKITQTIETLTSMVEGQYNSGKVDLKTTTENAQTRNNEAKSMVKAQSESQGKVSQALDWIAGKFGGMTEEEANRIISEHESKLKELESLKGDYKAYCAKFKEIFGVNYSKDAIGNYTRLNDLYEKGYKAYQTQLVFDKYFEEELKTGGKENATQKDFDDLYNKLVKMFEKEIVDSVLKQSNATTVSEKYKILCALVKETSEFNRMQTLKTCGGRDFETLAQERESAFYAAYGMNNDTVLKAQDWVLSQKTRLAYTEVGATILMVAGTVFTGGALGLLCGAATIANPVALAEMATDPEGMTAEDWKNFGQNSLENVGWMALGFGAGKVGQLTKNLVKLKGLNYLAKTSGKSIDDLLKNKNLPADLAREIQQYRSIAQNCGTTTEILVDISVTAALQKDGATTGDWIGTIAGALIGKKLDLKLDGKTEAQQIKALQNAFKSLEITAVEAKQILKKAGSLIAEPKTKVRTGNAACGIDPVAAARTVKAAAEIVAGTAKNVYNAIKNSTDVIKATFNEKEMARLNKLRAKNPEMADAVQETCDELTTFIAKGGIPDRKSYSEIIEKVAQKHGVSPDDLKDYMEIYVEDFYGWSDISFLFTLSPSEAKMYEDSVISFKVKKGLVEDTTPKLDLKFNEKELELLSRTPELKEPMMEILNNLALKLNDGRIPTQSEFKTYVKEAASKYGVDAENLSAVILDKLQKMDDWKRLHTAITYPAHARDEDFINKTIVDFKTAQGLYSKEQEAAVEALYKELQNKVVAGETPCRELLKETAHNIATQMGVSPEELIQCISIRMKNVYGWKELSDCFTKPAYTVGKPISQVARFKDALGIKDEGKVETKPQNKQQASAKSTQKSDFKVTDEIMDKYPEVQETGFYDSDTQWKVYELFEKYNMKEFDERALFQEIIDLGVNDNDIDRVIKLVKERFHKDVIVKEAKIKEMSAKYNLSEEILAETDKVIDILRQKMNNGERLSPDDIDELLSKNISDQRLLDRCENRIYDEPDLKNWLNDCTHRDIYNNREIQAKYYDEQIEETTRALDRILERVNNGEEFTRELIEHYTQRFKYIGSDELLEEILKSHHKLGSIYPQV